MRVAPADRHALVAIGQMAAAFAASDVLRGALRLAASLVIARGLGRDAFAGWTLWAAWASALTVAFDLGFGVLLTREAARDETAIGPLVTGALTLRLLLFAPAAAWLCVAPATIGCPRALAPAVAALAAAGIAYGAIAAVFRATRARLVTILAVEALGAAAQCAGAIVVVLRGGSVLQLLWLATGVLVAEIGVATCLFPAWRTGRLRHSPSQLGSLLRRALPFAASGIVANAQARLGPLMLGMLSGPGDLAAFGVATRLEATVKRVPYAAFGAALPVFSSSAGRSRNVRRRFNTLVRIFSIAAAAILVAAAAPLVRITYGRAFAEAATPLMWAGASLVPVLVNSSRKVYLNATGREHLVVRWSAIALILQIAAGFALMPSFGASGAILATAAGEVAIWFPLRAAEGATTADDPWAAPAAVDGAVLGA